MNTYIYIYIYKFKEHNYYVSNSYIYYLNEIDNTTDVVKGPLTHTANGITTVYGIVSGPSSTSLPECKSLAVFTRVSAPVIRDWIINILGRFACNGLTSFNYDLLVFWFGRCKC